jgi:hypothetical protein
MAEDYKSFDGMFSPKPSSKWQVQQSSHTHPKIKKTLERLLSRARCNHFRLNFSFTSCDPVPLTLTIN